MTVASSFTRPNRWGRIGEHYMSKSNHTGQSDQADRALGMNQPIDRRDFMNSMLLGSGAALLGSMNPRQIMAADDWTGYGGVGDYARSNGNTYEVINAGHQIRDRVFEKNPRATDEAFQGGWFRSGVWKSGG